MNHEAKKFEHLLNNLDKISNKNSIFSYKSRRKAFLSLGQGNIDKWLDSLLPNTRLIIEPKIIGYSIGIQYENGTLSKIINKNSIEITEKVKALRIIPKRIAINKRIEIQGLLYLNKNSSIKRKQAELIDIQYESKELKEIRFCAFHIFHCRINQFEALQELKNLNFEIPENEFTIFISDIEIYRQYWKEGYLFNRYPTNGLVLKINSRKLQKYLGENKISINWAYAIN
tara:strand:+ start:125 stop:811 length:687 start_codon:yes stop_codon:yes gene_type:complete